MSKTKQLKFVLLTTVLLLLCVAAVVAIAAWQLLPLFNQADLVSEINEPPPTITSTLIPRVEPAPPTSSPAITAAPVQAATAELESELQERGEAGQASPLQLSTEQLLLQANIPERDQRLLAIRLKNNGQDIPKIVHHPARSLAPGDTDTFWVTDNQQTPPRQFQANATLKYITPHSYWWVQNGFNVHEADLKRSAERFENETYPTNRAFFGSEWSPGVDGDVRVHIFMGDVPGVAGYFSASNQYSTLAEPYSNEREMFFVNLKAMLPGNAYFDSVLAHEFQHMIHWHQDRNEDTWVNEGMSELATFINGYGVSNFVGAFTATPDTQLTGWADVPGEALANYGGSFLFMSYFLQRFGEEMTQAVVAHPYNGLAGFNAVLAEHGYAERFDDIFADFLIANYLNDPTNNPGGLWDYRDIPFSPVFPTERHSVYPVEQQATVYQYGSDYLELTGRGDLSLDFSGAAQVKVVNNQAHSGQYQWYSHRGDDSNSRLTRAFDLGGVSRATLKYWTWYDIESDWDYGYVEVSTNGGQSWSILTTPHSNTANHSGNAYGPGYTGTSGGGEPIWLEEKIDISDYTGQEVLIRFEYVTDDAVNRPGWTLDDISIPEIDFYDDVENGLNGWLAEGFVRMDNLLRQKFLVQLIEVGADVNVRRLPLDEANRAATTITGLGDSLDRVILVVSGLTPVTTEPASYEYKITSLD